MSYHVTNAKDKYLFSIRKNMLQLNIVAARIKAKVFVSFDAFVLMNQL